MIIFGSIVAFPGQLQVTGGSRKGCADIVGQVCDILFQLFLSLLILKLVSVPGRKNPVQNPAQCQQRALPGGYRQLDMASFLDGLQLTADEADGCIKPQQENQEKEAGKA